MSHLLSGIERLLKETMGLDPASLGPSSIRQAVQERQAACGLEDTAAYWDHLRSATHELEALIEAVVVPETWFFRERDAFAGLVEWVRQAWLPQDPPGPLRALSLPCSTGEEPYSMAMALLDAGLPADRFVIDAVDISRHALQGAAAAVYGRNAFRGADLGFRERHFEPTPDGYRLAQRVRRQVRFLQGNLFADDLLPAGQVYDLIFCRNVLIYFDAPMQQRAVSVIVRLLKPSGCLFVGSAEAGVLSPQQFVPARTIRGPAFRRTPTSPTAPAVPARARVAPPPRPSGRAMPASVPRRVDAPAAAPETPGDLIERAGRLADQGQLDQAEALCRQQLQAHGASAPALYLLGLIQDARGARADAADCYRKVLYLEPWHGAALIHLAALLDQQGDEAGARLLRARLERLDAGRPAR